MLKEFKTALEQELGCSVTLTLTVYGQNLRSNDNALDVAIKLEKMISTVEPDVQTNIRFGEEGRTLWFAVKGRENVVGNRAKVFLPYPDSVKQVN